MLLQIGELRDPRVQGPDDGADDAPGGARADHRPAARGRGRQARRSRSGTACGVEWEGKLGLIAGVTPVIDEQHAFLAVMGERFVLYRLPEVTRREIARRSLERRGHEQRAA